MEFKQFPQELLLISSFEIILSGNIFHVIGGDVLSFLSVLSLMGTNVPVASCVIGADLQYHFRKYCFFPKIFSCLWVCLVLSIICRERLTTKL